MECKAGCIGVADCEGVDDCIGVGKRGCDVAGEGTMGQCTLDKDWGSTGQGGGPKIDGVEEQCKLVKN